MYCVTKPGADDDEDSKEACQRRCSLSDRHGAGSGARLRLARQARGFSQQQLAGMAGVSRQAVSAVESGLSDPSLRAALALARALGMTVEELFGPASSGDRRSRPGRSRRSATRAPGHACAGGRGVVALPLRAPR